MAHQQFDIGLVTRPASEAQGESESLKQRISLLFEEHNATLIRFLSARLHSDEEAREIAQEAYVKLLGLDDPDSISHFRAYLFRVAANLAADRLKQRRRRARLRNIAFAGAEQTAPSPERGVDALQELAIVRAAIQELPPKCRTAFLLHKVHEAPIAETARRMQLSIRMVQLYVARGLAHCAERLASAAPNAGSVNERSQKERHVHKA